MSFNLKIARQQTGFTLLEVMIAMVIFSIGLLGLAGIQAVAMKNNNTAYLRTIAMQHSYNMADLIRTSTSPTGAVETTFSNVTSALGSEPPDCIVDNATTNCSSSEMATFDIFHWKKRLASKDGLPSGRGTVTLDVPTSIYEIKIMWDEDRTGTIGESCGTSDLKCYIIHIQT